MTVEINVNNISLFFSIAQILVVGPTGCGKSECIKMYAVAERERGKSLSIQSVFTKAFDPNAFLGHFNEQK